MGEGCCGGEGCGWAPPGVHGGWCATVHGRGEGKALCHASRCQGWRRATHAEGPSTGTTAVGRAARRRQRCPRCCASCRAAAGRAAAAGATAAPAAAGPALPPPVGLQNGAARGRESGADLRTQGAHIPAPAPPCCAPTTVLKGMRTRFLGAAPPLPSRCGILQVQHPANHWAHYSRTGLRDSTRCAPLGPGPGHLDGARSARRGECSAAAI
ncbi:MAG: hypothetical protein J3K34DRAFT_262425 [Monoraphidium minutum]|nr:MAG: hypothetical protein J3K34DRAFT_262425 [Monoraphidium minutum]